MPKDPPEDPPKDPPENLPEDPGSPAPSPDGVASPAEVSRSAAEVSRSAAEQRRMKYAEALKAWEEERRCQDRLKSYTELRREMETAYDEFVPAADARLLLMGMDAGLSMEEAKDFAQVVHIKILNDEAFDPRHPGRLGYIGRRFCYDIGGELERLGKTGRPGGVPIKRLDEGPDIAVGAEPEHDPQADAFGKKLRRFLRVAKKESGKKAFSDNQTVALYLEWLGCPREEIALKLSCTKGNVATYVFRARRTLKAMIGLDAVEDRVLWARRDTEAEKAKYLGVTIHGYRVLQRSVESKRGPVKLSPEESRALELKQKAGERENPGDEMYAGQPGRGTSQEAWQARRTEYYEKSLAAAERKIKESIRTPQEQQVHDLDQLPSSWWSHKAARDVGLAPDEYRAALAAANAKVDNFLAHAKFDDFLDEIDEGDQ